MITVWELVKSGGWMMLPIILSSIVAMAIVVERLWTLRASRVTPPHLLGQVWMWIKDKQLTSDKLKSLRADSPLGEILLELGQDRELAIIDLDLGTVAAAAL